MITAKSVWMYPPVGLCVLWMLLLLLLLLAVTEGRHPATVLPGSKEVKEWASRPFPAISIIFLTNSDRKLCPRCDMMLQDLQQMQAATAAEVRVVDEQTPSAFGSLQRLIQQSPLINSQLRIQAPMMILFRDQVAQQLAELTDPVAWTRLMLRLSAEEPLLHVDSKKKKSELASSEAALTFRAVALLDEHKGAKDRMELERAARVFSNEYTFAYTTDPKLGRSFKLGKNPPLLKVFGLHDKVGVVYPGKTFTRNAILEFLRKMALHMCVELNSSWSSELMGSARKPLLMGFYDPTASKETTLLAKSLREARLQAPDSDMTEKINCVLINVQEHKHTSKRFSVGKSKSLPRVTLVDTDLKSKYPFTAAPLDGSSHAVDALQVFFRQFLDKKIFPVFKSAPIPPPSKSPVVTLVRDNFNQIARDPTRDVLVKFYTSWCGHCKALAPIYHAIAEAYEQDEAMVIATYNMEENDEPEGMEITSFPTLYLFPGLTPRSKFAPVQFFGPRDFDNIQAFLQQNRLLDLCRSLPLQQTLGISLQQRV